MSRFINHVSVVWDVTGFFDWVPVLPSCHHHLYANVVPTPPVIPVPFGFSVELPSIIAHPPGALMGDHKLTSTVYHNHVWIALDGHDLGKLLVHVCVPPAAPGPCTLMAFNIALSSRKAKFSAGEVKANGTPIACCTMIETENLAPTPMMICGVTPIPAAGCGTSVAFNSMLVGMHWVDMLAGWMDVAITMVQSTLTNLGPEAGNWMDGLGFDPIPDFGGLVGNGFRALGQEYAGYHGDWTFQYQPLGGPFGEISESVSRDGDSGDITHQQTAGPRAGGLGGVTTTHRDVYRSDGTHTEQWEGQGSWIGGGQRTGGVERTDGGAWQHSPRGGNDASLPWSEGTEVPFL